MSRLIDADALWRDITTAYDDCEDILEIIERQPTIEPQPEPTNDCISREAAVTICLEEWANGNTGAPRVGMKISELPQAKPERREQ